MSDPELHIARRNVPLECGALVGRLNVKLSNGTMEFIGVYCTKGKLHRDACEFVGVELVISRRRREDGLNASLILPRSHD